MNKSNEPMNRARRTLVLQGLDRIKDSMIEHGGIQLSKLLKSNKDVSVFS